MIFTERIEKLLGSNHIKEVIDEFLKFLSEVPQSNTDARSDANQLRGQIIILSGRFTELNTKINTNSIDPGAANQEKSALLNSFIQILNQLPSNYPDLNTYLEGKNEDDEWKDAQNKNTIEAYQNYFGKYPNGKYKAATIKLIAELEDVKLKQDSEIKRLALLEKERRENDKALAESQKAQAGTTPNRAFITPDTNAYTSATISAPPPAKSRKGLYIVLGAVLGILLIIIIANLSSGDETSTTANDEAVPVADEQQSGEPSGTVKAELISAIRLADDAEVSASNSLNTEVLNKSYTGEALKTEVSKIEEMKQNGTYVSSTLEQQDFQSFKLSADGLEAEVKAEETWSSTIFNNSTNDCMGKVPSTKVPQTFYLKKSENGWLITSIVYDNLVSPEPVPCN